MSAFSWKAFQLIIHHSAFSVYLMEVTFMAARKVVDCRLFPSENNCTLTIAGTEDEVLKAAMEHAVSSHGHADTPEFREQLRSAMQEEQG
jgi:predicted small metal-binding protein